MIDINQYMLLSKEERQNHLDLKSTCIIRGGGEKRASVHCRGLLAHILDTTIPKNRKIHLCHACHNGECYNPFHMYWGTNAENNQDTIDNGGLNFHQKMLHKYGADYKIMLKARAANGGKGNKGIKNKRLSEKHISEVMKKKHRELVRS